MQAIVREEVWEGIRKNEIRVLSPKYSFSASAGWRDKTGTTKTYIRQKSVMQVSM